MKNKGYTLVEVICAIVIVGIVFVAMASMLVSSTKINKKFVVKENMVAEVESLFNLFSSEPDKFMDYVNNFYTVKSVTIEEIEKNRIYFSSKFISSKVTEDNYIEFSYSPDTENDKYTLKIDVYYENNIVKEYSGLKRSIIKKVSTSG